VLPSLLIAAVPGQDIALQILAEESMPAAKLQLRAWRGDLTTRLGKRFVSCP